MDRAAESHVTKAMAARIPAEVRRKLGIGPGDDLVWAVEADHVKIWVKRGTRQGFADFKPFDFGQDTRGGADHDDAK